MGGSSSKNPVVTESFALFSQPERDKIESTWLGICGSGRILLCSHAALQNYLSDKVSSSLADSLCRYVFQEEACLNPDKLNPARPSAGLEGIAVALAKSLRGTVEEKAKIIKSFAGGTVTRSTLSKVLVTLIESTYIALKQQGKLHSWSLSSSEKSWSSLACMLVSSINGSDDEMIELEKLERWLSGCPLVQKMLHTTVLNAFPVIEENAYSSSPLFPECVGADWSRVTSLLDFSSVLCLTDAVPSLTCTPWRLVYSSRIQGLSFGTMIKAIRERGPALLVLKDTDGHIFGGYSSESWAPRGTFYGSSECFLFTTEPALQVFHSTSSTSYNDNFMYLNMGQETLPNGLGMGGQFDYFGLWLSSDFGEGHSKAEPKCSTYGSSQLSARTQFSFSDLEVWCIGPDPLQRDEDDGETREVSILDKDATATAMLELINKGPVSEGLRDEGPEEAGS